MDDMLIWSQRSKLVSSWMIKVLFYSFTKCVQQWALLKCAQEHDYRNLGNLLLSVGKNKKTDHYLLLSLMYVMVPVLWRLYRRKSIFILFLDSRALTHIIRPSKRKRGMIFREQLLRDDVQQTESRHRFLGVPNRLDWYTRKKVIILVNPTKKEVCSHYKRRCPVQVNNVFTYTNNYLIC